ncbi:single-stranded-DNA-specific exonuclease RecJ [Flammeovirga yaeyamensis]|uniref:Single-stranded-DNA-specific exonuclease RecJ n=1 Tax=Flammeovirga yaeyamensis TaxID=367791 RepID=A0AAX1N593_9BACT|nr:single-stranded-DNA-specific exonuclease RecJ [Flammeovirga yaeyamensis]MBB3701473.1 single-stranded-DNA-specific exonuclease [Flammeovirga yaeyamensis]NMF38598.1 single-stranded-DNA-specific exonuclease RecJ [Flammeovirga yaeyamensis]QWG02739.1 single-stranded-DNA-specific exonuclease RecJ [Flammeovirga yaeyamensis]
MNKEWKLAELPKEEYVKELSKQPNVPLLITQLLAQRGVKTLPEARNYFRPTLEKLHDPFLMKDMDVAVARLTIAIEKGERILFYGDYDADGTTAVALYMHFFRSVYNNVDYYIPDKYAEGYGVSERGIDYAHTTNCQLIISLDCGITSFEAIDAANRRNIDFIVCDHHQVGEELPKATAVLNPQREDCNYPFKGLSGCGVGFKLLQGFCQKHGIDPTPLWSHLDLVALGTACDVVPMVDENRVLCHQGVSYLKKTKKAGLLALFSSLKLDQNNITLNDLAYSLGPVINAAGRVAHAQYAASILSTEDPKEAKELAVELNRLNGLRRKYDQQNTEEAFTLGEEEKDNSILVLYKEDWHKGVLGIVASKCVAQFGKPTICLTHSRGEVTGSVRSTDNFDIHELLTDCDDLLDKFGGHTSAAGLSLKEENLSAFKERVIDKVDKKMNGKEFVSFRNIDLKVNLADINLSVANILQQMKPFGHENEIPVFLAEKVKVTDTPRVLKDKHLKFNIVQHEGDQALSVIAFNQVEKLEVITTSVFDILFKLEINEFRGNKTLQLNCVDIKKSENE